MSASLSVLLAMFLTVSLPWDEYGMSTLNTEALGLVCLAPNFFSPRLDGGALSAYSGGSLRGFLSTVDADARVLFDPLAVGAPGRLSAF